MPKPQSPNPIITCTWMARVRPQLSFLQHRYHTSTRRSHKTRWTNIHFQPWKMPEMGRPADQMAIHTSPSSVQHLLSISASRQPAFMTPFRVIHAITINQQSKHAKRQPMKSPSCRAALHQHTHHIQKALTAHLATGMHIITGIFILYNATWGV